MHCCWPWNFTMGIKEAYFGICLIGDTTYWGTILMLCIWRRMSLKIFFILLWTTKRKLWTTKNKNARLDLENKPIHQVNYKIKMHINLGFKILLRKKLILFEIEATCGFNICCEFTCYFLWIYLWNFLLKISPTKILTGNQ